MSTYHQLRMVCDPYEAERVALEWMRSAGFVRPVLTPAGADGGVDIWSGEAVAQVKATAKPVSRPVIQRLAGIAVLHGRQAIVFSLRGFTRQAIDWANAASVALYTLSLDRQVQPANPIAGRIRPGHIWMREESEEDRSTRQWILESTGDTASDAAEVDELIGYGTRRYHASIEASIRLWRCNESHESIFRIEPDALDTAVVKRNQLSITTQSPLRKGQSGIESKERTYVVSLKSANQVICTVEDIAESLGFRIADLRWMATRTNVKGLCAKHWSGNHLHSE